MAEINRQIKAVLAARRKKAYDDLEARKAEAYEKIPELSRIDEEIALSGVRLARLNIGSKSGDDSSKELSNRIAALNSQKSSLLMKNGYPSYYLEPQYTCPVCGDTGVAGSTEYFETNLCSCYRRLYLENLYRISNILGDGQTGFEFFDGSFYSDTPDVKCYDSEYSPRAQIQSIKEHCLNFINGFENPSTPNLYFFGSAGTGKTFMAKSVGLELLKRGYTVLYLSAPTLFETIRRARFGQDGDDWNQDSSYLDLVNTQLLILDDLGTEPVSDARYAEFLTLLEARKARSARGTAKMIISTNLGIKLLYQRYNERIVSRIAGEFDSLRFFGEDIRIVKKYKQTKDLKKPGT